MLSLMNLRRLEHPEPTEPQGVMVRLRRFFMGIGGHDTRPGEDGRATQSGPDAELARAHRVLDENLRLSARFGEMVEDAGADALDDSTVYGETHQSQ